MTLAKWVSSVMKKRNRVTRWQIVKKRWRKSWGENLYNLRQFTKSFRHALKRFFRAPKRRTQRRLRAPVIQLFIFTVFLCIAGVMSVSVPYCWKSYKSWSLHQQGMEFWEQGEYSNAFWSGLASSDYSNGNDSYQNLLLIANSADKIKHYNTLSLMEQVVNSPKSSQDDVIQLVNIALKNKDFLLAEKYFPRIVSLIGNNSRVSFFHLQLISRNWRSNQEEALELARSLVKEKKIEDVELNRIYTNLCLRDSASFQEGLSFLYKLCRREDDSGLMALKRILKLENGRSITLQQKSSFLYAYRNHPLAKRDDQIFAFTYGFQEGLIPHSELDRFVESQFGVNQPANISIQDLHLLHKWLLEINLPHKLTRYIPLEVARKDKFFYTDYLHVMMDSGKVKQVLELLNVSTPIFTKSERTLLHAIALQKDGSTAYAKSNFNLAFARADEDELSMFAHEYKNIQYTPNLIEYLERCLKNPSSMKLARALLLKSYYQQNMERKLLELIEKMNLNDYLDNPDHMTNLIHVNILYNRNLPECLSAMELLASTYPDDPRHLLILGLAYYVNEKPEKALKIIEENQINYLFRTPSNQTIAAVILDANDRVKDSRHFLRNLDPTNLIPSERKLLSRLNTPHVFRNHPSFQEILQQ